VSEAPSQPTKPATLRGLLEELERQFRPHLAKLAETSRVAMFASDADLRRGLVTMNGAGLLAVISLLSQSLDPLAVRISVLFYLAGLVAACLGWSANAAATRGVALLDLKLEEGRTKMQPPHPLLDKELTTVEDVTSVGSALTKAIENVGRQLKKPGRLVPLYSYVAIGCFLVSTCLLVGDFELRPISEKPDLAHCPPTASAPALSRAHRARAYSNPA
jgi:hypothetical protein